MLRPTPSSSAAAPARSFWSIRTTKRAVAEAEDILHATPFTNIVRVYAGDYADLADATIVIIAAGVSQRPGETRLELLERNTAVFANVVPASLRAAPDAILLVATNPVDVMTMVTTQLSGLPASRVIGSGTILDTARFRALLGQHLGHLAQIRPRLRAGRARRQRGPLLVDLRCRCRRRSRTTHDRSAVPWTPTAKARIDDATRRAAYKIIEGKGATWYGIAGGLVRICRAIGRNEQSVLTVSMLCDDIAGVGPVALSLPRVIGRSGVSETIWPSLTADESAALTRSAEVIIEAAGR